MSIEFIYPEFEVIRNELCKLPKMCFLLSHQSFKNRKERLFSTRKCQLAGKYDERNL